MPNWIRAREHDKQKTKKMERRERPGGGQEEARRRPRKLPANR
jgi:hypothetical protein